VAKVKFFVEQAVFFATENDGARVVIHELRREHPGGLRQRVILAFPRGRADDVLERTDGLDQGIRNGGRLDQIEGVNRHFLRVAKLAARCDNAQIMQPKILHGSSHAADVIRAFGTDEHDGGKRVHKSQYFITAWRNTSTENRFSNNLIDPKVTALMTIRYPRIMDALHQHQVLEFIGQIVNIPKAELETFCQQASYREIHAGTDLVRAGEVCRELWFIHTGTFRYYLLTNGQDHTKDFSPRLSLCTALTSLVTRTPSQIYISAIQKAQISVWNGDDILERFNSNLPWQTLARRLIEGLYIRKERREVSFLTENASARYRRFQSEFHSIAHGEDTSERVPQHYIASYLGMTPETLSRVRRKLRPR
jgi:CRP-like cAMP-binding protein